MTTATVPLMIEVTLGDTNNDGIHESQNDDSIGDDCSELEHHTSASSIIQQ